MALIKIFGDGTFETAQAAAVGANHTKPGKPTYATAIKAIKEVIKRADRDLVTTAKIDTLKATREKERTMKVKLRTSKVAADVKARVVSRQIIKINKLTDAIDTLTAKLSAGKYLKPVVLKKRATSAQAKLKTFEAKLTAQKAKLAAAPKTPRAKPDPRMILDGAPRTPRVPKDHGAAFGREAKLAAGSISRGIRSELRDHGKTALVPVANRASAQAPKAVPSSKKADTATTHATKSARGAIGNTLTEIKKIKASIATGTLKGAKLIRAREELEKQREALRGLRAGKTAKNQKAIIAPGSAAHMGGAKKIVGKPSGMGDAAAKEKRSFHRVALKEIQTNLARGTDSKGTPYSAAKKRGMLKAVNEHKAALAVK